MKTKNGNSLIEVIIALGILMIIASILSVVFSFTTKSYSMLRKYNKRLDVVEYLSKNLLHNYSYEEIKILVNNDIGRCRLVFDSDTITNELNNYSMKDIMLRHKNNETGDIEVNFKMIDAEHKVTIKIGANTYGNQYKNYEIIKMAYDN